MTDTELFKTEACPTRCGTTSAYEVQVRIGHDPTWRRGTGTASRRSGGVPQPLVDGGINDTLGLLGYEQAMALAWALLAESRADGRYDIQVRVVPYRVKYECKAWQDEAGIIDLTKEQP